MFARDQCGTCWFCRDDAASATPAQDGRGGWDEEMRRRGVPLDGLRPPGDATTVRVRHDDVLLTDGPFAETKDQIGGFSWSAPDDSTVPDDRP